MCGVGCWMGWGVGIGACLGGPRVPGGGCCCCCIRGLSPFLPPSDPPRLDIQTTGLTVGLIDFSRFFPTAYRLWYLLVPDIQTTGLTGGPIDFSRFFLVPSRACVNILTTRLTGVPIDFSLLLLSHSLPAVVPFLYFCGHADNWTDRRTC